MKPQTTALLLISKIQRKGGIIGSCAKLYSHDNKLAEQFVMECGDQCHNQLTRLMWGNDLVDEIINYTSSLKRNRQDKSALDVNL